jgi:hypothetical protein
VVFGLLVAACATPGCGRKQQQPIKLLLVAGKVTVDGRPLADGTVVCWPDPAKGNPGKQPATGAISSAGNYELYTTNGEKGAPPGWYKAIVFPYTLNAIERVPKRAPEEIPDSPVPAPYMDLDTTPLSIEVTERPAEEAYDLKLTR